MAVGSGVYRAGRPSRVVQALVLITLCGAAAEARPPVEDVRQRLLAAHNRERLSLGIAPLRWSNELAANAAGWAAHLARTGAFEHAEIEDEGENLWMGTAGAFSPEEMVGGWTEERRHFRRGVFPENSSTGDWQDVGHYTQLIWRGTVQVGCAVATGRGSDYLVCRYSSPGNIVGEQPL